MRNYETKVYDYVDKKTGAHVVKATTMYAGRNVSAVAKCEPGDTFDLKFGTDVALKRLDIKIALKREASMKAYAKFCQMNLDFIAQEKKRVTQARDRAEIAALDRKLEAKELEKELNDMLSSLN
jgi:hypothetical protein